MSKEGMDKLELLSLPSIQKFIRENEGADPHQLALKHREVDNVPIRIVADQIDQRQRAKKKLPQWFSNSEIIFPAKLSLEQCSSELTAKYKANLISGNTMYDLSAGMGVDTYYLSESFDRSYYIEQKEELCLFAEYNFSALGAADRIKVINGSAEEYLNTIEQKVDLIYLDPARRGMANKKIAILKDCQPNVVDLLPKLIKKANHVLIKTSPLLDIDLAIKQLGNVSQVHVISVNNDCKEVLYYLTGDSTETEIYTVNFLADGTSQQFRFEGNSESISKSHLGNLNKFLYEPNASVMKAGAFKTVGQSFGLSKLGQHTHLYTSDELRESFPGRAFNVEVTIPFSKKAILKYVTSKKANITVRNFPLSVADIRKKTGIKDGGNIYLFAFRAMDNSLQAAICSKVN